MRIHVITTGCSINRAMGEILKSIISKHYTLSDLGSADFVILNLCTIKKATEDKGIELAKKISGMGKRVIVTGCLAESSYSRIQRQVPDASIISAGYFLETNIVEIINSILQRGKLIIVGKDLDLHYPIDYIPDNQYIGIIPIALGCTNNCSYCIDVRIWGRVRSIPPNEIVKQVEKLIQHGAREIRLTAHDTAAYGIDIGYNLADLLERILSIDYEFRIRIGMASPNTFELISDALLDIISKERRIYKFVHIPVQSGSNRILKLMNRPYTVEEYISLFQKIRRKLGETATIATDVISAFPTETEEDHKATMELLKKLEPDVVNLSRYGDRPGTPSSKLRPKIHSKIAKRRTRELFELIKKIAYKRNLAFLGKKINVLFLEKKGQYCGRSFNNRLVFTNDPVKLGEFKTVKITNVTWKCLYGTPETT